YNFRKLRRDLEKAGHAFLTQSDTEVLLHAYVQHGERVPTVLNGQFAFLIWDQRERTLFGARDRLGEKPLYWAEGDRGTALFASEIKAPLASGLLRGQLDPAAVEAYLGLLYVPPERTIYSNVRTLPPAHALAWAEGRVRTWRYWRPGYSANGTIHPAE